ncbi:hypothetical protein ANCCAN_00327 [Ancylostoma caninum]|uniref:Uncharacterized protein n=1 Tax=Ancylostoma caninum TaxID=29170 RepID=A0A368HD58_ANCCA|nr:hypothetical protein ANCCAN_00327 [Ancylostoma caninum]
MIVKGLLLIYFPKKGEDLQVFIQNLRSFLLATAGIFVLLFRHPGILGLTTVQCSLWFLVSTTCYTLAIGTFILEAINALEVVRMEHWNTWSDEYCRKPHSALTLSRRITSIAITLAAIVVMALSEEFNRVSSTWSCLGRFSTNTIDLWLPLILFNMCSAMAASSFSFDGLFIMLQLPQYGEKLDIDLRSMPAVEPAPIRKAIIGPLDEGEEENHYRGS